MKLNLPVRPFNSSSVSKVPLAARLETTLAIFIHSSLTDTL